MSRPVTPASLVTARFPILSASHDTTTSLSPVSAEVLQTRSVSSTGRDVRAKEILDQSVGEKALAGDPKTKREWAKFTQLIDRVLVSFESATEWADFITFLGKLLKCLQTFPHFAYVPHKIIVAKRLAQCLNPALPTGVHQRALDVYVHILNAIGPENLRRDLQLWSSGIFPFFQYAATSVRPILLGIYSKFYIPLQEHLRPATKAMILALLPGLDEETSDFFDRVAGLLDQLSGTVSPSFFLQNIWLVLITAPSLRIAALNYLSKRMPKIGPDDSIAHVVGQDVGLMVRAFAASLGDSHILVQRSTLDLVLSVLPLNGAGFVQDTRHEDQVILVQAMMAVVLRRDLSLSRRLYTWLLGPSDGSATQLEFYRQHGLELLRQAVIAEMQTFSSSPDATLAQRPYKIVISLLDKWEISFPLIEVVVLDLLRQLEKVLSAETFHPELVTTVNMLFDAIDPFLMWKELFKSAKSQLQSPASGTNDILDLIAFVLHTFRLNDDEFTRLHAPLLAFALIDCLSAANIEESNIDDLLMAVTISHALLKETAPTFFAIADIGVDSQMQAQSGLSVATDFYSAQNNKTARIPATGFSNRLLVSGLGSLLDWIKRGPHTVDKRKELFSATLHLLSYAAELPPRNHQIHLQWQPETWLKVVIDHLESLSTTLQTFEVVDSAVRCLLAIDGAPLNPTLQMDRPEVTGVITDILLNFLQSDTTPCHVQAVSLLWALEDVSGFQLVESAICRRLCSKQEEQRMSAYEAFGNLWRFTDDSHLPGVRLGIAMRIMLDALRSHDLATRRAGEAWMRCSLKSYLRILDPLYSALLDSKIVSKEETLHVGSLDVTIHRYQRDFDHAQIHHTLESLSSLAGFGGQGFTRLAKISWLQQSTFQALHEVAAKAGILSCSYLDALCRILVRFLLSESCSTTSTAIDAAHKYIHAMAADLLQIIVSRGDVDLAVLAIIEQALLSRLYLCVHRREFDLQNKLLHVLHSAIAASSSLQKQPDRRSKDSSSTTPANTSRKDISHNPLLMRVLCDGLTTQSNSAVTHHWVDFLLTTLPLLRFESGASVFPLVDAITATLGDLIADLAAAYDVHSKGKQTAASVTEADYTILLNALERLFATAFENANTSGVSDLPNQSVGSITEKVSANSDNSAGFLGFIGTALGAVDIQNSDPSDTPNPQSALTTKLHHFVHVLIRAWSVSSRLEAQSDPNNMTSQSHISSHIRLRTRKALERIYKTNSAEVFQAMLQEWQVSGPSSAPPPSQEPVQDTILEILDFLAPAAQTIVVLLTEYIARQFTSDRSKHAANVPSTGETLRFAFLLAYLGRVSGPVAVQVWISFHTFVKDIASNPQQHKYRLLPTLRCFAIIAEKIATTSALEDRRMRRDLHDAFIKLVDATIQASGRSGDGLRRSTNEMQIPLTPLLETPGNDAMEASIMSEKAAPQTGAGYVDGSKDLASFLAHTIVPDFRLFAMDNDKLATTCTNIMYYNVSPAFKTRSKSFDVDDSVLDLLSELTKVPAALKAWRTQALEVFSDNRFFYGTPSSHRKWRSIIQALVASDKERFPDLIARISASSSANIFANREYESLSRAISIRRLSYSIFCGEKNRYLVQLPAIQEKVVELLRAQVSDIVHCEVYLCLRVLLCRIGNQHLSSFWPIILAELLRLFETLMHETATPSSEYLQLILSACKFLDLLLVLQTEEFQIHQWMFITDTVDAAYPPESWTPQAIMDRLGEIISGRLDLLNSSRSPITSNGGVSMSAGDAHQPLSAGMAPRFSIASIDRTSTTGQRLVRPLLANVRLCKISALSALEPFFSRASLSNYESVYALGGVDWAAVESSLECDLFEGDVVA